MSLAALALLFVAASPTAPVADELSEKGAKAAVYAFFDAMRASDGEAMRALFIEDATLTSVGTGKDGKPFFRRTPNEGFVKAVGKRKEQVWDEQISKVRVQLNGNLASVWMDYKFYLDEALHHCGINVFTLFYDGAKWRVLNIADTRNDC